MKMEQLIDLMLEKDKVWAVVGATQNQEKFGYKLYMKLKNTGYKVFPVNPVYDTVDGDICYDTLEDLPEKVDCVDVVVGPSRSIHVLEKTKALDIPYIWFQPGTFNDDILTRAEEMKIPHVYLDCVLAVLNRRGE